MIYILHALTRRSFIRKEVNRIVKESIDTPDDFNFAKFDAKETPLRDVIDACLEVPLLENKKVVILDDAYFLAGGKNKDDVNTQKDFDLLIKYFVKPVEETNLIITVYADKLEQRSKIYKSINDNVKVIAFAPLKEYEWEKYVKETVSKSGAKIDYSALRELSKRTLNDRDKLLSEIDKLILYNPNISLQNVIALTSEPIEDKSYTLTNFLLNGDIAEALFIYNDLINTKSSDPIAILLMLGNMFRLCNQILYLHNQGYEIDKIASELSIHEYRAKVIYQSAKKIKNKIADILEEIYQIDYKIKSGQCDHFVIVQLFIINFKSNYLR